jgi:uncharacterized damage-inducible protein DinB
MSEHPLVTQLKFTRSEFARIFAGVSEADAARRFEPMNCLAWIAGHLANQEQRYWLQRSQGRILYPDLNDLVGYGKPASTPSLKEMLAAWKEITAAADDYLNTLTPEIMDTFPVWNGKQIDEKIGTLLLRNTYHYWYHTGEAAAIRQMLGHTRLPEYVGDIAKAQYRPE